MQLSMSECRELKDLLLSESQEIPSSPSPLLEILENMELSAETSKPDPITTPKLEGLKPKYKTFPQTTFNKSAHLFLKMVSTEIEALPNSSKPPTNLSQN